jgi:hypothetical protein
LLGELNVKPRNQFMARITNPASGERFPDDFVSHGAGHGDAEHGNGHGQEHGHEAEAKHEVHDG